jgi:hypothetical protein
VFSSFALLLASKAIGRIGGTLEFIKNWREVSLIGIAYSKTGGSLNTVPAMKR